jgi:hypothetical protein
MPFDCASLKWHNYSGSKKLLQNLKWLDVAPGLLFFKGLRCSRFSWGTPHGNSLDTEVVISQYIEIPRCSDHSPTLMRAKPLHTGQ